MTEKEKSIHEQFIELFGDEDDGVHYDEEKMVTLWNTMFPPKNREEET